MATSPFLLNNPLLTKMVQDRQQQAAQPQTVPNPPAPDAMNVPPAIGRIEHTHDIAGMAPSASPALAPAPIAPQKPLAKINPVQPNPAELAHQTEFNRLTGVGPSPEQGKSGIGQINNPIGRTLLQIADAVGGGLFPRIAMNIPGTQLHHNMLVRNERGALEQEQGNRAKTAQEELEAAKAEHQINTEDQAAKSPTSEIGLFLQDPAKFAQYREMVQRAQATGKPEFIKDGQGNIVGMIDGKGVPHSASDPALDPQAKAIMDAAKAKEPAEKEGEMPIGDERAAAGTASLAAQYKEAGLPVPPYAQLNGKHTQKDEARILGLAKDEITAHRQNQEFAQREADRRAQVAMNQGNRANDQITRAYDNFDKKMTAELGPLQTQIETTQEARRLINGGSVEQFLGTVKTLVGVAGGRGSGVRITQAELNGIPAARGVAGGFEGFVNSLQGKGKLSSDQIRQVNEALGQIEALAAAKRDRINKYMDQAVSAKSPDEIRRIEQQYRHEEAQATPAGGGGSAQGQGGYQVGHKYGGMTYQGGDPNNRASWK